MSLVANINRRKKLGISRSKKKSTVSANSYKAMKISGKRNSEWQRRKRVIYFLKKNTKVEVDLKRLVFLKTLQELNGLL